MECNFCNDNINRVDYKNREFLRRFVTSQFKIATSRRNKICNKHQRMIANAVKNARFMALMPYTRLQIAKRQLSK
ncbi:MAG: 30S ribosomal protein S18 [Candidatus Taylorbacteria bacterium]|nr:30S ribosomal protein S18 [Candidatus Taylorbacteria bacterium]